MSRSLAVTIELDRILMNVFPLFSKKKVVREAFINSSSRNFFLPFASFGRWVGKHLMHVATDEGKKT